MARGIWAPLRDFDLIALAAAQPHHGQARSPSKALQRGFFSLVFHNDLDDHLLKLGFTPHPRFLVPMRQGELPPIQSGPQSGRRPEIHTIIQPVLSPGLEKVVANLQFRPPGLSDHSLTDIQIASAKRLATELSQAGSNGDAVRTRVLEALSQREAPPPRN